VACGKDRALVDRSAECAETRCVPTSFGSLAQSVRGLQRDRACKDFRECEQFAPTHDIEQEVLVTRRSRALAWAVHAYTASGIVLAALAAIMIVRGGDEAIRAALLLFVLASVVDATDGVLARAARVHERLPGFDGRRMDDIVDFHTYTSLPLLLLWRIDALPGGHAWLLLVPLVASLYGFSRTAAKTDDGAFLGFPSYWNVVALYIFLLSPAPLASAVIIVVLACLTLVPTKYLYPSMGGTVNRITVAFGAVWAAAVVVMLVQPATPRSMILASLVFPAWYMAASWYTSLARS
jgi:phosphatidylcholine synthase